MLKFIRSDEIILIYDYKNPYNLSFKLMDIFIDYDCLGRPATMIAKCGDDKKLLTGDYNLSVSFESYSPFDRRGFINLHYNLFDEFMRNKNEKQE